jgi:hypothetical protein
MPLRWNFLAENVILETFKPKEYSHFAIASPTVKKVSDLYFPN